MSDLSLIKELREKTGAGFLDCKNALAENNYNVDDSIDSLRKKGLAKATKKSNREAKEGAVGFYSNENISIILKINSETDFSAKSDTFLDFMDFIGNIALSQNDLNINLDSLFKVKENNKSISDLLTEMISKIGENLIINDLKVLDNTNNYVNFGESQSMGFNKNNMFKGTKLSYLYQTTGPYEYQCSLNKYE